MSIDIATVRRIARLARLALSADEAEKMCGELDEILAFIEQLLEVDVQGILPMTSVMPTTMKMRQDVVTEGNHAEEIVANAPLSERNFFLVPKILE
ncbi:MULTISPECIES: Asp-tRNA(Asn)/Glu-tRNA(Gln) amidotransferase subunit GatC [Rhizobium]|jgi:aspartyl-tRNA(Asn)/glutamyl-tRNA(Gln) amidotransferase subunit C|uniref:Aspartyl/glutamyl-tRNA(Asn/Gln) amidotransferase subunit C n=3 Tax=Rhizobium TaxID=379 RepID=A0A7W6FL14_9HYPH|nr:MULTISPECIES: Asp-tRNA(Asn)/Glu-tRNA(Gln) amidotransferase subunit GatC [Rhizobium]NKK74335.1 Asp-tRNA(Asn)/Glu-tRNA(Gln) amidotransferase subunit GatC [Rhizobium leguminosarum bv. viciae]MBB3302825.1 aspartyl-tRNA(Asn)/glutamyl-tRNA(Gln) amidotransferase subunit C [Rhizobium sp. BK112]MBB3372308.1 aspartyl-tRNA(Asn)/glutamyl-tRNA(Gln) amidotransferase subunit C [Rhizobium sp. BK077]MBB3917692.1 aspartyl-tRNA(Asn)/glutamyl-tRNA(Gln) amidotransferase subunit C [Rhizobium fabae]MBB4182685.1 a